MVIRTSTISTSPVAVVFLVCFLSRIARLIDGHDKTFNWVNRSSPILVKLNCRDDNVTGVNTDGSRGAVRLVTLDAINVNHPFLTIHLCNLPFTPLVFSPDNANLVVLANR